MCIIGANFPYLNLLTSEGIPMCANIHGRFIMQTNSSRQQLNEAPGLNYRFVTNANQHRIFLSGWHEYIPGTSSWQFS
jgi:hypothetical protein